MFCAFYSVSYGKKNVAAAPCPKMYLPCFIWNAYQKHSNAHVMPIQGKPVGLICMYYTHT